MRVENALAVLLLGMVIGAIWWTSIYAITPVLVIALAALGWVLTALLAGADAQRVDHRWRSVVLVLGAVLMIMLSWKALVTTAQPFTAVVEDANAKLLLAALLLPVLLGPLYARATTTTQLAAATRLLCWLVLLLLLQLLSESSWPVLLQELVGRGFWPTTALFMLVWSLELLWRGWLLRSEANPSTHVLMLVLFRRWNPVSAGLDLLQHAFGIDLAGTWVIVFLRKSVEPMVVSVVALCWLLSGVTIVAPHQRGVRQTLGSLSLDIVQPGLVLHWPRPFGQVKVVDVGRVQSISIGHADEGSETPASVERVLARVSRALLPDDAQVPAVLLEDVEEESLLWANQHSDEEFSLLLGDGRDLIAADGVLQYRITDPHSYLTVSQNPEHVIESLVYRVLMRETARRTLEQALSENLNQLAKEVTDAIRQDAAAVSVGIEPVGFYFSALHPPVAVAEDYQSVVSSQIDERSIVIRAETHRRRLLPRADSDRNVALSQAEAEAVQRRAEAVGEAAAFNGLRVSVREAEELYVFRRQAEALEQNLTGRSIVIVDDRIEADGGELWIQP